MGFINFLENLSGAKYEEKPQPGKYYNDRADFLDRPGSLYVCINKDSKNVTYVKLCDLQSPYKEDTFEAFIKEVAKHFRKQEYLPNEVLLNYYVNDMGRVPIINPTDNNHLVPYIKQMEPVMKIGLYDAVFALKNDIDLISNGRCFSGWTNKKGYSEKFNRFIAENETKKMEAILTYYIDEIHEQYKMDKSISRPNALYNILIKYPNDEKRVEMMVSLLGERKDLYEAIMPLLQPVLYNTIWGQKNISPDGMLNYLAKYEMKYLSRDFKNEAMMNLFKIYGLMPLVENWNKAVKDLDWYLMSHEYPSHISCNQESVTASQHLANIMKEREHEIGRECYAILCRKIPRMLSQHPELKVDKLFPDFYRADSPIQKPTAAQLERLQAANNVNQNRTPNKLSIFK